MEVLVVMALVLVAEMVAVRVMMDKAKNKDVVIGMMKVEELVAPAAAVVEKVVEMEAAVETEVMVLQETAQMLVERLDVP